MPRVDMHKMYRWWEHAWNDVGEQIETDLLKGVPSKQKKSWGEDNYSGCKCNSWKTIN